MKNLLAFMGLIVLVVTGCKTRHASDSETRSMDHVTSFKHQNDGCNTYKVECEDGTTEIRGLDEFEAGDVCNPTTVKAKVNCFKWNGRKMIRVENAESPLPSNIQTPATPSPSQAPVVQNPAPPKVWTCTARNYSTGLTGSAKNTKKETAISQAIANCGGAEGCVLEGCK
jgi:hypothetical protein